MQIVGDPDRFYSEKIAEPPVGLLVELKRFAVFQVADMLADDRFVSLTESEGVFQLRAGGDNAFDTA